MTCKPVFSAAALALLVSQWAWGETVIEEVFVTAERKSESLQETSLAIDVVSDEELVTRGINSAQDLSKLLPALTVTSGGGITSALYMRGVGNFTNNSYLDPAIIINYDGVPLARANAAGARMYYDLERVEALKGPQGTLYGRNATGGNLNVVPKRPELGETSGYVTGSFGNYDDINLQGAINVPLGEVAALRLSGAYNDRDGYNKDGSNDSDFNAFRLQLLAKPTENLDLRLGVDYSDIGGAGQGTTVVGAYQPTGLGTYALAPSGLAENEGQNTAAANAYRTSNLGAPGFGFLTPIQDDWGVDAQMLGITGELNYSTDAGTLTILPAWRSTEQDSLFGDPAFNSGWFDEDIEQTSLEVRWAGSAGESIDYIVGAFYIDEEIEGNNTFNQEYVLPLQDYEQTGDSRALFGQATFNLSDATRLIVGLRYTDDEKDFGGGINNFITFCGGPPPNLITPPGSFAQGCATPGNLPIFPTLDTVDQANAFLADNGWAAAFIPVAPGVTVIPLTSGAATILHINDTFSDDYQESDTTYRVALEWDVLEDSMLYASFQTGYRAGGFQTASALGYEPEYIDAYTLGAKNRFFDGALELNLEIFRWEYEDQQISYFTLQNGVLANLTDNVGESTNQGIDIDLIWAAGRNTLISAKAQFLDAKYDELVFVTSPPRDNVNCPFEITGPAPELTFTCSDNDAIFSPDLVLQFGLHHTIPLDGMNLTARVFTTYTDDQVTGFFNLEHEVIDSFWRTDLDLTLEAEDQRWAVSAYARNIEDERNVQSTIASPLGFATSNYGPDMTYGMRLSYRF